jgi:hypothetical protein
VPVVIFFSKARKRALRDNHAAIFNFVDVFGKGARGRIQQGTAANRTSSIYIIFQILQGESHFVRPGLFQSQFRHSDQGALSLPANRHEGLS